MNIAITGGAGFLGRRVVEALLGDARIKRITVVDVVDPQPFGGDERIVLRRGDLADAPFARSVAEGVDVLFHLAAVVSGQAEAEFDVGMRVNLDATRALLEGCRSAGRRPRFVFSSSLAVFGPPLPAIITEDTAVSPQSSYGCQKAMAELLVCDYGRKGFVDSRVLRLPTICVRPGRPNAAASSFVSSIIREPLHGQPAVCPVGRQLELWLSSPRQAVANLVHGGMLPADAFQSRRIVNVPGITVTIAEMIAALERVGGADAAARITFADDPVVRRIVSSWPARFDVAPALSLGFRRDVAFDDLVREFLADEAPAGRVMNA